MILLIQKTFLQLKQLLQFSLSTIALITPKPIIIYCTRLEVVEMSDLLSGMDKHGTIP